MTDKIKKETGTITLFFSSGNHPEVPATILNDWVAVHKGCFHDNGELKFQNGVWIVTHVPTGFTFGTNSYTTKREALAFATKIAPITEAAVTEHAKFGEIAYEHSQIIADTVVLARTTQGDLRQALIDTGALPIGATSE